MNDDTKFILEKMERVEVRFTNQLFQVEKRILAKISPLTAAYYKLMGGAVVAGVVGSILVEIAIRAVFKH